MNLTKNQLKELVHGAYAFKNTTDGYLYFSHYSDEQLEYLTFNKFFYDRAMFSSSVTLEFFTEATKIGFSHKLLEIGSIDSLDVYVDGVAVAILSLKDVAGEGCLEFALPLGKKQVTVYLPVDLTFAIKDFWIDGEYQPLPKRKTKVLWMGDSITQGYGTAYTGHSYVNVANRLLGYEIINQGIGGYYYDYKILKPLPQFPPDKIIVAMGFNGHTNPKKEEMIGDFYKTLVELYPNVPILAVTPLWSGADWSDMQGLLDTAKYIRENAEKYPQMKVVDGFKLVPHVNEYFIDSVHPNAIGMELYGRNLAAVIKEINF